MYDWQVNIWEVASYLFKSEGLGRTVSAVMGSAPSLRRRTVVSLLLALIASTTTVTLHSHAQERDPVRLGEASEGGEAETAGKCLNYPSLQVSFNIARKIASHLTPIICLHQWHFFLTQPWDST